MIQVDKEQAIQFLKEGHLEEAYKAYQAIRDKYPDDWIIYDGLSYLENNLKGNLNESRRLIEKARELGCPEARCHRLCADIFWSKGQLEEANHEYEQAVIADRSIDNLAAFANSLMKLNYGRAVPVWQEIIEKDPSNAKANLGLAWIARKQNNWSLALEMATKVKEFQPENAEALFAMGQAYKGLNQYEQALKYYLEAHKRGFKEKFCLHVNIAHGYLELKNYTKALEHAHEAVKLNRQDPTANKLLNRCKEYLFWLCGEQRYSEAYPAMVVALHIWPDDSRLLAYMAILEMAFKHNYELGQNYMRKALECKSPELDLLYEIKGCLWFDYLNDKREGLAFLEKAVALNRNKLNLQSLAYRIIDVDHERAQRIYDELYRSAPEDIDVICGLAEIAMKQGNWSKGFELAKKSNELAPSISRTSALLACAHFHLGRYEESLEFYVKAAELDFPDKAYIYNSIAECHLKLGKLRKARKYIKKALDVDPNNPESKRLLSEMR